LTSKLNNIHNIQFNGDNINHLSTFTDNTKSTNNIYDMVIDMNAINNDNEDK